jgi:hypothetical protein
MSRIVVRTNVTWPLVVHWVPADPEGSVGDEPPQDRVRPARTRARWRALIGASGRVRLARSV